MGKTTVTSCLEVSKKACAFMIFTLQSFAIVILIMIPPVSEFVNSSTVILCTMYLTRQEVAQIFITTFKSMINFINLLINKRLKCVSFVTFLQIWQRFLLHFLDPTSLSPTG